jgi:hypothetical protein
MRKQPLRLRKLLLHLTGNALTERAAAKLIEEAESSFR